MKFPSILRLRLPKLSVFVLFLLGLCRLEGAYGDLIWSRETGGILYAAPAIGPMGEIVIGSEDGNVYSYNPDGSVRWVFTEATDWIDSSPTIASDVTVYVGSWDNFLYAIDGNSGTLKWKFETGGLVIGSPAIGPDGTVYIGSNDSFLYAINPDGSQQWVSEAVESYSPINSSPVLNASGDTVYFGNDNGEVFAVAATTGTQRWSFSATGGVPPADGEEVAIVGTPAIGTGGDLYVGCENGNLYCLDVAGNLRWSFETLETIRSSPAISRDGTIIFAAQDGYLYALDSEGFELWETFVGDVFYCSPALDADGNILIAGYAGSSLGAATLFTSVDRSGDVIWEHLIPNYNDSSPNIAPDGSIFFGAHDGILYKFEGAAPLMDGQWPRFQSNRRQTGLAADLSTAELVDFFPSITQSSGGWAYVPWFGSGWITAAGLPWIRHQEHGPLYLHAGSASGALYFDFSLQQWLYATALAPDYYYETGAATWIHHVRGSTITSGRFFYDLTGSLWFGAF